MPIARVTGYQHLRASELARPTNAQVFFDPPDTETLVWAASDLITITSGVLDLGSGSGAATAAFVRSGARHAHGLELSEESVRWAEDHYGARSGDGSVTFSVCDYLHEPTDRLVQSWPDAVRPTIVASNPPYVPTGSTAPAVSLVTDGGPDGLLFLPTILGHVAKLDASMALVLGSYSYPSGACRAIDDAGLQIRSITMTAVLFGPWSLGNHDHIVELAREGSAYLWQPPGASRPGYVVLGLACEQRQTDQGFKPSEIELLVRLACDSETQALELITEANARSGTARILQLPLDHNHHL